ncbi:MAG: alternative ribosome rescue aminoacyl-tRNA hydrolase ArfB [Bacteroidota bacterium]
MRDCLISEVSYRTSRSSGPGGQHVNKTESRVELLWSPARSACISAPQKVLVLKRLAPRLTDQGVLILSSEKHRSQHRNKEEVTERFIQLVTVSMIPVMKRVPTRPLKSSLENRIREKKIRGEVKKMRRNPSSG